MKISIMRTRLQLCFLLHRTIIAYRLSLIAYRLSPIVVQIGG